MNISTVETLKIESESRRKQFTRACTGLYSFNDLWNVLGLLAHKEISKERILILEYVHDNIILHNCRYELERNAKQRDGVCL